MPWKPMTEQEAVDVLASAPPPGGAEVADFARLIEARLVAAGAEPARIRAAVELFLGHPLESQ